MNLNSNEMIVLVSLKRILTRFDDPYMISFEIDNISNEIIQLMILNQDNLTKIEFKMFDLIMQIYALKIDIMDLNNLDRFLQSSNYYSRLFSDYKLEITKYVESYISENISNNCIVLDKTDNRVYVMDLNISLSLIDKLYLTESNNINVQTSEISFDQEKNNIIAELRKTYLSAEEGYQMTSLHLFGIKNSSILSRYSVKELATAALGKESLAVEIGKGVKLSKFVQINDLEKSNNSKEITPLMALFNEFWNGYVEYAKSNNMGYLAKSSPRPKHYYNIGVGDSRFNFTINCSAKHKKSIRVGIWISNNMDLYNYLLSCRSTIDNSIQFDLDWIRRDTSIAKHIWGNVINEFNIEDKKQWINYYSIICTHLVEFTKLITELILIYDEN